MLPRDAWDNNTGRTPQGANTPRTDGKRSVPATSAKKNDVPQPKDTPSQRHPSSGVNEPSSEELKKKVQRLDDEYKKAVSVGKGDVCGG